MKEATPGVIYLKDYSQPAYWITNVDLVFELGEKQTQVKSTLSIQRNANVPAEQSLILNGEELELVTISLNDRALTSSEYETSETELKIFSVPETCQLEITTSIKPQENTSLEGLYKSSGNFCTQCEAEGFRKITYYLDRPDVMATFSTTIIADKTRYPVLLSNGNPAGSGELDDGRHWARWDDPFKKPCYLFALVAGDLEYVEDSFTTMSGRLIQLRIYVQKHNIDQCDHAMESLKKSMLWDEETYGREYDLDVYNIVAVDDFNMGAMENKGLNIFNSKYVLAKQETATDSDFINIEGVIAHEYFHNWSGNRVTCRDWFQLTLKEGLTVFRDQQFTADMNAATPKRIDDVNILRTSQFAEDAGPMAHPVQPDSYIEINNFYTVTVYNKGAEIIRMIHTILGEDGFRKGMDLYFTRHDGQAVTTEDFISAMEDANSVDFNQFRNWYKQAGTPLVSIDEKYDDVKMEYVLTLSQATKPTPGQDSKKPFDIPVVVSLLDSSGKVMEVEYQNNRSDEHTLRLTEDKSSFNFYDVHEKPVLSIFRNFSAPVKMNFDRSNEELAFCMAHDNDEFNRWDAGQQLATRIILNMTDELGRNKDLMLPAYFVHAVTQTLGNELLDNALKARAVSLPSHAYVAEMMDVIDVDGIHRAREFIQQQLATHLYQQWLDIYNLSTASTFELSTEAMGQRFMKNTALSYMIYSGDVEAEELAYKQFQQSTNMTDQLSAFRVLVHTASRYGEEVIQSFYDQWHHDQLVMDKWFMIQAMAPLPGTHQRIEELLAHRDFDLKNPNRVRSLLGSFCAANPVCFHDVSGNGYRLLAQYVEKLDRINPQIAARLSIPLTRWRRYDENRQMVIHRELDRLLQLQGLSKDVYEVVSKSLK